MKVFKFGGGALKDAESIRQSVEILKKYSGQSLVVVVSAFGKTTNAIEVLLDASLQNNPSKDLYFKEIKLFHQNILELLFSDPGAEVHKGVAVIFNQMKQQLTKCTGKDYNFEYDQLISFGELLSTTILSAYFKSYGIANQWIDARKIIKTDNHYRSAQVNLEKTSFQAQKQIQLNSNHPEVFISQGFIGSEPGGHTTTLGREGSDYSAALFAHALDAEEVVIWKDVPGVMSADPKEFEGALKFDSISSRETLELAFYGAKVIHPKTIKPLQNKKIPLLVKSFYNPKEEGTRICEDAITEPRLSCLIRKKKQVLFSLSTPDFSFIDVEKLHTIFSLLDKHRISINLIQNSAISFSFCMDEQNGMDELLWEFQKLFIVKYNTGLELFTIRRYTAELIDLYSKGREILLVQKSRSTARLVLR